MDLFAEHSVALGHDSRCRHGGGVVPDSDHEVVRIDNHNVRGLHFLGDMINRELP